MGGAILIHLTVLGIEVQGDNGYLFALALTVAICCAVILGFNKQRIFTLLANIRKKK
jgi:hypothetical protein